MFASLTLAENVFIFCSAFIFQTADLWIILGDDYGFYHFSVHHAFTVIIIRLNYIFR